MIWYSRELILRFQTLYVAVTRCRANLRIVEEDLSIAELIVDLWTQKVPKPLIDTVRPNDANVSGIMFRYSHLECFGNDSNRPSVGSGKDKGFTIRKLGKSSLVVKKRTALDGEEIV